MEYRLGQLLVDAGVLTDPQVEQVLAHQNGSGEPFGLISERMFGVSPAAIEDAWAAQYARWTRHVDPALEVFEPRALELITRRQAWQFRVLPVRFDGNELMLVTTQRHIRRGLRFANNVLGVPSFFVMAKAVDLGSALCRHYALPGMTPESVDDMALDQIFSNGETRAQAPAA
jgi:hypothetical protein